MSIRVPAKAAADAIVIGGGVHGCFTALHLARLGADVVLLEQDQIGRHASGVNAGSIHHIPRIHFELPLAERALAAWEGMEEILEDDCGFRQVGYLKLIETEAEMAAADAAMARVQRHCTIPETRLDREALHDLEPGLAGTLLGGIWASRCGYASPARTMEALRRQMHAAGVTVLEGVQLDTLRRDQGTWVCRADDRQWAAPLLLNCAGAWGGTLSAVLGEPLALQMVALMMTVTARTAPLLNSVIGLHGRRLSIKQVANGTVLIGGGYQGTVLAATRDTRLNAAALSYNLALAQTVLPGLAGAVALRCWAGIEGIAPDHAAYIGPSLIQEGLWHCFGFSTHGFYLGPVVGPLLAEAIHTGTVPDLLKPFALDRPSLGQAATADEPPPATDRPVTPAQS